MLLFRSMKDTQQRMVETIIICPTCDGNGVVKCNVKLPSTILSKTAYDLQQQRYSLREIGLKLNIKGPQLVKYYIGEWKKHLKNIKKF